ncbi:uncharacterized protein K02A2.6-like, partial [Rhagoletis pomonella]|uniref:uncharacterized protein K02A2.6-like n=1 Tax=Rhagoletis pomonella TaxID=28610 RepID=UPI0017876965
MATTENIIMAQIIGTVPHFKYNENNWEVFITQLQQFFTGNRISEAVRKKAILLTALSEKSYILLQNLLNPLKPEAESTSFAKCVEVLSEYFKPPSTGFAERQKFYSASKEVTESVNEWAVRVRALAIHCKFGNFLDTAMRDKFVMGLERGPARDKIFLEDITSCTMQRVVEIANAAEYIRKQNATTEVKRETEDSLNYIKGNKSNKRVGAAKQKQQKQQKQTCAVCGYANHLSRDCKFRNYKCHKCNNKGHLKNMCPSEKKNEKFNYVDNSDVPLFSMRSVSDGPIKVRVHVDNAPLDLELDTGSEYSVLSCATFKTYFSLRSLKQCNIVLKTYNGLAINPVGVCDMMVAYNGCSHLVTFVVIENGGPPLLGRNFVRTFKLNIAELNYTKVDVGAREQIFNKFRNLFDGSLGCFNKGKATLKLKENYTPKFFKPRVVPLAIKSKVENEVNKLIDLGVLEPVSYAEWGTPIVPVLKKTGDVRICGDFKVTLNPQLMVDKYPLPRIEDIFAKLHGGEEFTKLDLTMAYQQIPLDEVSKKLTTISTPKGLFQYTRLIYGLASAPAIFQKIMESLLMNLQGTVVFLDDILITAPNRKTHIERVEKVLQVLEKSGFKLALNKCEFFAKEITYLGHVIDTHGLHTNPDKVKEIDKIQYPNNVKELQAFLGVVNFYRKFIPNITTMCAPLYKLLKADETFSFTGECKKSVDRLKAALKADKCLAHFNPGYETKLTVDASPLGLGAILSQVTAEGYEVPIEFASRKLSAAEMRYSQLDKEAIAILFGVKKFHNYLYGRHFKLVTDNKPLHYIFNPRKGIPVYAANRLQRIAITLSGYDFEIKHIRSNENVADYFSRNPSSIIKESGDLIDNVALNFFKEVNSSPVNAELIRKESLGDESLKN